jgi:hypothetical protein
MHRCIVDVSLVIACFILDYSSVGATGSDGGAVRARATAPLLDESFVALDVIVRVV